MKDDERYSVEIDDDNVRQLLPTYLANRRNDLDRMKTALSMDRFRVISGIAHNLFGSGTAYGLRQLSRIGARLEAAADQRDPDQIRELLDELDAFLARVHVA